MELEAGPLQKACCTSSSICCRFRLQLQIIPLGSSAVSGKSMQNSEPGSPLQSLPQLPLSIILQSLDKEDRRRLASVCRSFAAVVSSSASRSQVTVTSSTRLRGLAKVLSTRTLACQTLRIEGTTRRPWLIDWLLRQHTTETAVEFLLQPGTLDLTFPGIRKLSINAHPLPSLLPSKLASLLPDLEELHVNWRANWGAHNAQPQPIPYCSGLRKISCIAVVPNLPSEYHTSEELRRQLPNVVSLYLYLWSSNVTSFSTVNCIAQTFINAWSDQLTELVLDSNQAPVQLQHCMQLQSLGCSHCTAKLSDLPLSLTQLQVGNITESHLQTILQLPLLQNISFFSFVGDLHQDWSKHPCAWRQLKAVNLEMAHLSKLPLHALKGQGCLNIEYLEMPNPLLPDSLSTVLHASQCVSNMGIKIQGFREWKLQLPQMTDRARLVQTDTVLAAMFRASCSIIRPCQSYHLTPVFALYKQAATEIIMWLSPELRFLQVPDVLEASHPYWKALCHCKNLEKLTKMGSKAFEINIAASVLQASDCYVAVTHRTLILSFPLQDFHAAAAKLDASLKLMLQVQLPAGVMLAEECVSLSSGEVVVTLQPKEL